MKKRKIPKNLPIKIWNFFPGNAVANILSHLKVATGCIKSFDKMQLTPLILTEWLVLIGSFPTCLSPCLNFLKFEKIEKLNILSKNYQKWQLCPLFYFFRKSMESCSPSQRTVVYHFPEKFFRPICIHLMVGCTSRPYLLKNFSRKFFYHS